MRAKRTSRRKKTYCIFLILAILFGAFLYYKVNTLNRDADENGFVHRTFEGTVKSFDNDGVIISPYWSADREIAFYYDAQTVYIDENLIIDAPVIIEAEYPANADQPYPVVSVEVDQRITG